MPNSSNDKVQPQTVYVIDMQEGIWREDQALHDMIVAVAREHDWGNDAYHSYSFEDGTYEEDVEEWGEASAKFNQVLKEQGYTPYDKIFIHYWW